MVIPTWLGLLFSLVAKETKVLLDGPFLWHSSKISRSSFLQQKWILKVLRQICTCAQTTTKNTPTWIYKILSTSKLQDMNPNSSNELMEDSPLYWHRTRVGANKKVAVRLRYPVRKGRIIKGVSPKPTWFKRLSCFSSRNLKFSCKELLNLTGASSLRQTCLSLHGEAAPFTKGPCKFRD